MSIPFKSDIEVGAITATDITDNISTQKVVVSDTGSAVGTRKEINFIEGSNVTLTISDNSGSDRVDVTIASTGGSGSPGGSNKQVQFNNSSSFGGAAGFEYQSGSSPNVLVQSQGQSHVALRAKAHATHDGTDIFEVVNSANTALAAVGSGGRFIHYQDLSASTYTTNNAFTIIDTGNSNSSHFTIQPRRRDLTDIYVGSNWLRIYANNAGDSTGRLDLYSAELYLNAPNIYPQGDFTLTRTADTAGSPSNDLQFQSVTSAAFRLSKIYTQAEAGSDAARITFIPLTSTGTERLNIYSDGTFDVNGHLKSLQFTINDAGSDLDCRIEGDTDQNLIYTDASTDRVGIGIASPATKLDVNGVLSATNFIINEAGADLDCRIEGDTNANLLYTDASTDRVGIGIATPATLLDVNGVLSATNFIINEAGADLDCRIEGDTDANLVYTDASTDRVGIGTNAPGQKLDVSGTIKGNRYIPVVSTLTDAAPIAVDASLGEVFIITLTTSGRTIANPTNAVDGQRILFRFKQNSSGGPYTVVWDTNYRFPNGVSPTLTTTASRTDYIGFIYNSTDTKWDCLGTSLNFT